MTQSETSSSRRRDTGTLLALTALLILAVGLLVLVGLVLPQVLGIVLVVFGFLFVCVFHYVVWGWWLSNARTPRDDETAP